MAYWDEVLGNVPEGLMGSAQGMYDVASNPLQAAQGVGYYMAHPGEAASRAYGHYARRYKNLPTAMETFRQNPVSVAEDLLPLAALRGLAKKGAKAGAKKGAQEAARRELAGPGAMEGEVISPMPQIGYTPPPAEPMAPYYRNVPPEMGTSMRPMTPFQQNQVGLSTGRFGMQGYAPEMAVTDWESYAPGGVGRTTSGPTPMNKFDQNMMDAYLRGRMGSGASRGMYGEYTPEEMGSAVAPYRQGGLVYEPVGPQGAAPRQMGGPQGRPGIGYERGPIEGEWSEVYGIGGPRARPGYGGGMDFGVTREGMAVSPTGRSFDPRLAAAAGGGGLGFMAGRRREEQGLGPLPGWNPNIPRSGMATPGMGEMYPVMPMGAAPMAAAPMGATALSGQAPGAGTAFEGTPQAGGRKPLLPPSEVKGKGAKKGKEQGPPMPAFDPNLNYYVTQALDRLFGQDEASRGAQTQQYYATNPWPY